MNSNFVNLAKFLVLVFTIFLSACSQDLETNNLSQYSKNGINIEYPSGWKLKIDSSPGLYASRSIAFAITDVSIANIHIVEADELIQYSADTLQSFSERLYESLGLEGNDYIEGISETPVTIDGTNGKLYKWKDTMIETSHFEFYIFDLSRSKEHIFVTINLSDEDIQNHTSSIGPFLSNIKLVK